MSLIRIPGTHMSGSGIQEVWIESGLLGKGTLEAVLNCSGNLCYKAMRSHNITVQSLWEILLPEILAYFFEANNEQYIHILQLSQNVDKLHDLICLLQCDTYVQLFSRFIETKSSRNVNFKFWWQHIEMVSTLLSFIRAQREANWYLHLASVKMMIPYFFHYNHQNDVRWGILS